MRPSGAALQRQRWFDFKKIRGFADKSSAE
jgi:hypothetical protein